MATIEFQFAGTTTLAADIASAAEVAESSSVGNLNPKLNWHKRQRKDVFRGLLFSLIRRLLLTVSAEITDKAYQVLRPTRAYNIDICKLSLGGVVRKLLSWFVVLSLCSSSIALGQQYQQFGYQTADPVMQVGNPGMNGQPNQMQPGIVEPPPVVSTQPYPNQPISAVTPLEYRIQDLESKLEVMQGRVEATQIGVANSCFVDNYQGDFANCQDSNVGSGFYAGAAAVLMKPHFKEAFQLSRTDFQTGRQTLVPFAYDYEVTPRVYFGYRNSENLGFRLSHWDFDHQGQSSTFTSNGLEAYGAHVVSVIFPANIFAANFGETLNVQNRLETSTVNLHGTIDGTFKKGTYTAGVGIRYANLEQSYQATVLSQVGAPLADLSWERSFDGIGPSVIFDASKQLGCSKFSAVVSGGGALLFGQKTLQRTVFGDQSPQPAAPFLDLTDADEVVGIGEVTLGLEWATVLRRGQKLKLRGSYEGQLWAEAGAPTLGFLGFEGFGFQAEVSR